MRKIKNWILRFMCNQVIKAGQQSLSPHQYDNLEEAIEWIFKARTK